MKKAILVNDFASVGALNKMLEEGYEVQSADERGVYILTKEDNIKKSINTELSTNIILDKKQPHVRIEFDDIRDVPKVWVDGELMDDGANDKSLVSLKVDWNTDTATENHKGFDINYYDLTGERPMSRGLREGSVM
ncbi:hypothetical protein [Leuconostoc suionicum]|uniref:hypothetical protein n=1 Tax=Leuconostoc suionicum TaxID=1511761 RepID=UPI0032DF473F